ncbi:hypothetical protein JX265_002467 [Neoarthrinium moseri]|uniref:Acyltransferase 3 domain-containing protein n=1 Tax=Neoarthrinium moseri TaxID=1658444 RepID=A0A9P9WUG9_9PEZI|nr:hypothetical protein JX265_002467 [Neoarthrinium moseri]
MVFRTPEQLSAQDPEAYRDPETYGRSEDFEPLLSEKPYRRQISSWGDLLTLRKTPAQFSQPTASRGGVLGLPGLLLRLAFHHFFSVFSFVVPSFLVSLISHLRNGSSSSAQSNPKKPLHPTAYLDGLRGVAAFVVYIFHWSYLWFPFLRNGWYYSEEDPECKYWIQMPIIRAVHSGRASVTIFFIISGYVITIKTLSLIYASRRQQQQQQGQGQSQGPSNPSTSEAKVLDALAGSLFRRPFRLYLPIIASTLLVIVCIRYNLFVMDPMGGGQMPHAGNLSEQLQHWWENLVFTVNPFRNINGRHNIYGNPYDGHLWTIPIEFKGSLMVFTFLLAFARAKRWIHIAFVAGCTWWLVELGDIDQALFNVGLLLAELSLICPTDNRVSRSREPSPHENGHENGTTMAKTPKPRRSFVLLRHGVTLILFVVALHLFSYPEQHGTDSPGYKTLFTWLPEYYQGENDNQQLFWLAVGSVLFMLALMYSPATTRSFNIFTPAVYCVRRVLQACTSRLRPRAQKRSEGIMLPHSGPSSPALPGDVPPLSLDAPASEPLLQKPFTTAFAQYLGQVSYSLYLAHGTVNHTVGTRYIIPALGAWSSAQQQAEQMREGGDGDGADALLRSAWSTYMLMALWGSIVNTFVLFWVSDMFWRGVDVKCVTLTRWIGQKAWSS